MVLHTGALKKIRTWPKNWRIQWGQWDCKSKEMVVGIVCHVDVGVAKTRVRVRVRVRVREREG